MCYVEDMETTTSRPKMTAKTMTTSSVKSVQFEISGLVSAELATLLVVYGWTLSGQNGDLSWYLSPVCTTSEQINNARPASLRNYVTA